jgi:glycosyltransferase involved in cell wall biosynthesis
MTRRVAVVTSTPLFVEGGHLVIARSLVQALRDEGHQAELVLTPQNRFGRQGAAYLATWLTDVGLGADGRPVDQVISIRFPSYAVRHGHHVCWLNHTMREYYDQWPAFSASLTWKGRIKETARRAAVHAADRWLLKRNVTRVVAQSRSVQARLQRWGRIHSDVLYPPPPPRAYRCEGYGDYIFAVSRLTRLKRLSLLIEALANPEAAGISCVIAGEGEQHQELEQAIVSKNLSSRVKLIGRIDDRQMLDHLARCRAVCFPPFDEDYGFVTVEAFASAKAVITCADSGGPAELVADGVNGKVCPPRPEALALALREVMEDRTIAERMGHAAREKVASMTWPNAVHRLLTP